MKVIAPDSTYSRSPLFYVGDKHKLLSQILPLFPAQCSRLVEPFVGGGSVFLNAGVGQVLANDFDARLVGIHEYLSSFAGRPDELIEEILGIGQRFGLSCSYLGDQVPSAIKEFFPKTYFAEMNRSAYSSLKSAYNSSSMKDPKLLYALVVWGFNRMLRFNRKGEFNVPVGNVDFNANVAAALRSYTQKISTLGLTFSALDFESFLSGIHLQKTDLIYIDPPYLITGSEYNRGWNEEHELRLYALLDELNMGGIRFAVSNVETYGMKTNDILSKWMTQYTAHTVKSNYINYFDNGKKKIRELLVCNYD